MLMKPSVLSRPWLRSVVLLVSLCLWLNPAHAADARPDASVGQPKVKDPRFFEQHAAFLRRGQAGPVGLLFLGDSITEGWAGKGARVWQEILAAYQPANFGIGGDTTQNLIWRIEQGELDGLQPKLVVLLIGTNNSASHNAAEIVAADTKIVRLIRRKLPDAKLVLMAIFPRGPRKNRDGSLDDGVARMKTITAVNTQLAALGQDPAVHFLDIGSRFYDATGRIPDALMPDQLHPSEAGYVLWADALRPILTATFSR